MSIIDEFRKPINIVSISFGVISIIVSISIYVYSKQEALPTYLILDEKIKIFDSKSSTQTIKVLDKNSNIITDDIFLATMIFWNAGELPIEPENVRRAVQISLESIKSIIDYKIVNQTYPDIAKFSLNEVSTNRKENKINSLILDWKHFDPGFGARIQIIYTADDIADIKLQGNIVGIDHFQDARPLVKRCSGLQTFFLGMVSSLVLLPLLLARFIWKNHQGRKRYYYLILTFLIFFLGVYTVYITQFKGVEPPI